MIEDYLQPNVSNEDAVSLIKEKIRTKTPFVFTRFGDGEIHMINKNGYENFEKTVCRQWGYKYPNEIQLSYEEFGEVLKTSFIKSDLIGLMDKNCDIINLNYKPEHWSLKKDLVSSWGVDVNSLLICDHMLSRQKIFGSVDSFKEILQENSLNIITPYVKKMEDRNISELLGVDVTYTLNPENINLNNRDSVLKSFEKIESPVVIMGVGLLKDYGIILRDEFGKIALDMGATMDAWSGILSRSWFGEGNKQDYLVIK
jgi:hypothetical protein